MAGPLHQALHRLSVYLPRHLVKSRLKGERLTLPWSQRRTATVVHLEMRGGEAFWEELTRGGDVAFHRHVASLKALYRGLVCEALIRHDGILVHGDARRLVCVFPGRLGRGSAGQRVETDELRFSAQRALGCVVQMMRNAEACGSPACAELAIGVAGGRVREAILGGDARAVHLMGGGPMSRAGILASAAPAGRILLEGRVLQGLEAMAETEEHTSGSLLVSWNGPDREAEQSGPDPGDLGEEAVSEILEELGRLLPEPWRERLRAGEEERRVVQGAAIRLEARGGGEADPATFQPWLEVVLEEAASLGAILLGAGPVERDGIALLLFREGSQDGEEVVERISDRSPEGVGVEGRWEAGEFLLAGIGCDRRKLLLLEPLPESLRL